MIKLNSGTFTRAIEKAQSVRPLVQCTDTDETNFTFLVRRSDGGAAIVDIWHRGGVLWSSCDCPAGVGRGRGPMPCYHVAAAALSFGLLVTAPPLGAVINPAPEGAASPQLPAPLVPLAACAPDATAATATAALMGDTQWARMGAAVRGFGRRARGVWARRGWLVGASRA